MNSALRAVLTGAVAAVALVVVPGRALAQLPPAGAIYDLETAYGTALPYPSTYQDVTGISFVADTTGTEYVSFAFRETPAYFSLDNVCVAASTGTCSSGNLLADPGFESTNPTIDSNPGDLSSNFPPGWDRWIQPVDVSAIGVVAGTTYLYGCSSSGPFAGTYFWCDGSVEGFDAIYQPVSVTLGQTYDISFWLADNSHDDLIDTTGDGIDMLVYAGDTVPVGSVVIGGGPGGGSTVPEPSTLATLGTGLLSLAGLARRRFAKAA